MVKLKQTDPAYFMLFDRHITTPTIHNENCYVCRDPEYAQMGLPLCRVCYNCEGHISADDVVCDECGKDQNEELFTTEL